MNRIFIIVTVILLTLGAPMASAQSGYDLYQKALVKERAVGDVAEAIRLYQRVVKEFGNNRPLAAKAQLRMGLLYERLGRKAEAQRAFQAVVSQYVDQPDIARQAQAKITAAGQQAKTAAASANGKTAMMVRQVWANYPVDNNSGLILSAPSPDGRYLTFPDLSNTGTGGLAIREFATGETRPVAGSGSWSEGFALQSIVSPDSRQIAYQWLSLKDQLWVIRIIGLDKSPPRVFYSNAEVSWPVPVDWSPDGKYILALLGGRGDGSNQIALLAVADGSVRVLKSLDWRSPQKMCFSPDGRYIAYDFPPQEDSPNRDLFLLSTDASREISLVKHPADDFLLGWAPDGKTVLFTSDRTGTMSAWMIRVADGKPQGSPELVKPDIGRIQPLGFARNGSYYYGLSAGLRDLYLAELDPATGHLVSPPAPAAQRFLGTNRTPEWSPDGKYLAYLSRRGNQTNLFYKDTICIRSVESGEVRELSPKVGFMSRPRWYPDGRALLVQSYGGKNFLSLFRVDANTGEAALVLRAHSANLNKFQLSPDGKTVYGTRDNPPSEDGHPILAFDLTTGQEKEIYRGPKPRNQTLSPDGRRLAFFAWAGGKQPNILKVMPVTGGEPRELLRVESSNPVNPLAWTPDGRHLIFGRVAQSERKTELWRISVEGGEPQKLGLAMDSMIEDLHVHPDGRRMVFVAGRPKGEVWVMENFLPSAQVQRSSAARR